MLIEKQLSLKQTEEAFESLNSAIVEHANWLVHWNRSLICGLTPDEIKQTEYNACDCGFERWLKSDDAKFLMHMYEYTELNELHNHVHQCVNIILDNYRQGKLVLPVQYDAYVETEREFTKHVITLRDEVYKQIFSFDFLTSTMTRQAIFQVIDQEHSRLIRNKESSCLTFIDLDYFKNINDKYGHQVGDEILVFIADFFISHLRPYDSIGRYGGEEFLLCLPNTTPEEAKSIMQRLQRKLQQQAFTPEPDIPLPTVSIGVAAIIPNKAVKLALKRADSALYEAKALGRNRVEVWEEPE